MKITVDIDDRMLEEAMKACAAKSSGEAIELGLKELIHRRQMNAFKKELEAFDVDLTPDEMEWLQGEFQE